MEEQVEWPYNQMAVDAFEISVEEAVEMSAVDAKQVLINTFGYKGAILNDDEDAELNGWTFDASTKPVDNIEKVLDQLLVKAMGIETKDVGPTLYELTESAAKRITSKCVRSENSNLFYYFFTRSDAQAWINEMLLKVMKIKTPE